MSLNIPQLRTTINRVHQEGVRVKNEIKQRVYHEAQLVAQNKKNRSLLDRALTAIAPKPVIMYDTTTPDRPLPTLHPEAVAGYVGGAFADIVQLRAKYPSAIHLPIAVNASEAAAVLDVETGDATPNDAPAWVRRERNSGRWARPWIYANASTMPAVEAALSRAGIPRSWYRLWVAHYDGIATVPLGFDAKQFATVERGAYNYDVSVVAPGVFH